MVFGFVLEKHFAKGVETVLVTNPTQTIVASMKSYQSGKNIQLSRIHRRDVNKSVSGGLSSQ